MEAIEILHAKSKQFDLFNSDNVSKEYPFISLLRLKISLLALGYSKKYAKKQVIDKIDAIAIAASNRDKTNFKAVVCESLGWDDIVVIVMSNSLREIDRAISIIKAMTTKFLDLEPHPYAKRHLELTTAIGGKINTIFGNKKNNGAHTFASAKQHGGFSEYLNCSFICGQQKMKESLEAGDNCAVAPVEIQPPIDETVRATIGFETKPGHFEKPKVI
jgi:hypothetical protein